MDDSNVEMHFCVKICFGADFSQEVAIDWPCDCHWGWFTRAGNSREIQIGRQFAQPCWGRVALEVMDQIKILDEIFLVDSKLSNNHNIAFSWNWIGGRFV